MIITGELAVTRSRNQCMLVLNDSQTMLLVIGSMHQHEHVLIVLIHAGSQQQEYSAIIISFQRHVYYHLSHVARQPELFC